MSNIWYATRFKIDYYIPNSRSKSTFKVWSDSLGIMCYDHTVILKLCEDIGGLHWVMSDQDGNPNEILFKFKSNESRLAFEDSIKFIL